MTKTDIEWLEYANQFHYDNHPKETRLVISTEELKRITSHLAKQDDMQ